ncbi:pseudouridine synthase [Methylocella sp.]|uniref:pseudouridine synthase n=1 Tax=Methylocella sp. TaxID=1978226 RepID=UPI0037831411
MSPPARTQPKAARFRLDRLLASLGYGSRAQIALFLRAGRVTLDGVALHDPAQRIEASEAVFARLDIDGEPADPPPGMAVALNKPTGVTCSRKEAGKLVYDLLPDRFRLREPPLSTVGRLDKETSGLLLLTDDGALLHRLISPKSKIEKRYRARLARPLRGDEADIFASGALMLEGEVKPLLPARFEALGAKEAYVSVSEGRYHQVRRMFAALGNHVEALARDRIGAFALPPDLAEGASLILRAHELEARVRG